MQCIKIQSIFYNLFYLKIIQKSRFNKTLKKEYIKTDLKNFYYLIILLH
jgi:hypothetical protein